jgi:hypothetical protein
MDNLQIARGRFTNKAATGGHVPQSISVLEESIDDLWRWKFQTQLAQGPLKSSPGYEVLLEILERCTL